jgi:hypothetical protein
MPSTAIRRIAYEAESRTLSVWFRPSGRLYRYYDVPPDVHAAFRAAGSKGRFFNLNIRDRYPFQHVADPDDDDRHAA